MTHERVVILLNGPHGRVFWNPNAWDETFILAPKTRREGEVSRLVILVVDDITSAVRWQLVADQGIGTIERRPAVKDTWRGTMGKHTRTPRRRS